MPSRPNIALIGTGGTIAGSAASPTSATRYTPGSLGVDAILAAIPELSERYTFKTIQAFQLGSYDVTPNHWFELLQLVESSLSDPTVHAAVITHGTDSLEETACFLHLTVQSTKPVIVIGAMRPATAYSADGPANIIDACTVAAHKAAMGRGTMVVMNGRVHSALLVTKRHVSSVEAFDSGFEGALGEVADSALRWFRPAHRVTPLKLLPDALLPRVDLMSAYAGADDVAINAFVAAGAKAIVHAGLGNGNAPPGVRDSLKRLREHGVWLGRCSRWIPGSITRNSGMFQDDELSIITAKGLQAHKLRIAMMVAIANGLSPTECQYWLDSFWEQ
ncbi:MAG: asparaginase [Burkholderiaceae bacterium]|jgi:L-asparaginase type II